MAGIYIHIPFCKQACHYCNFHFSTSLKLVDDVVTAICQEIHLQRDYLEGQAVHSIYFGGGTPSILDGKHLDSIMQALDYNFNLSEIKEFTLEANPDDLSGAKLKALRAAGINRLSIGVQSFYDRDLQWMNRSHSSILAHECINLANKAGFKQYSIDLIFGVPGSTDEMWHQNLEIACQYGVKHLSCYGLTVEENTALHHQIRKGKMDAPDEGKSRDQFKITQEVLGEYGYDQYEISNYCLPGFEAYHNTNYWKHQPYLGVGPSAHSFDGGSRQWNIANNVKYLRSIEEGKVPCERELLSTVDRVNECLMTGLRTKWGCSISKLSAIDQELSDKVVSAAEAYDSKKIYLQNGHLYLTDEGKLIADTIISDLFV